MVIGRTRDAPYAPAQAVVVLAAVVPVSARSVRIGAAAAGLLAGVYAAVVGGASGLDHLAGQARADWYLLVPIVAGFGVQVALMAELRQRRRQARLAAAATGGGAGASAVGMVACCAHHVADLAPLAGLTGAAAFLGDQRVAFMVGGVVVNAVAVVLATRRLRHASRSSRKEPPVCAPVSSSP